MALHEAKALEARFELLLAVPDGPLRGDFGAHGELVGGAATLPLWGASFRRWTSGAVRTLLDAIRLARLIRRREVDIVLTNSSVSLAPVLAAKIARVPVLVHARDVPRSRLAPLVLAIHGRLADTVVVIADRLVPLFHAGHHTQVVRINDGIEIPAGPPVTGRAAFATPLRLCLVGGIDPRKGQDVAVAALAELRERGIIARLEFLGRDVDKHFAAHVRQGAAQLGLTRDVEFVGEVSDVEAHLAKADIVIVPSRDEWTPLVLMEALAQAKPVVASRVGAVAELLCDGKYGILVEPGSATELASAVARLASDPAAAVAMAEQGGRSIRADFTLRGTLEGLQTQVDRLLGPGSEEREREQRPVQAVV